jgi:hypothetical protein
MVLLHAAKLRHGTDGFTFPLKEGMLRTFSPEKSESFGKLGLTPFRKCLPPIWLAGVSVVSCRTSTDTELQNSLFLAVGFGNMPCQSCRSLSRRNVAQGAPLGCGSTLHTQCAALANRTECERYWGARTKVMENWLFSLLITITTLVTTPYYQDSYIYIYIYI